MVTSKRGLSLGFAIVVSSIACASHPDGLWRSPKYGINVLDTPAAEDFYTPDVLDDSTEHLLQGLYALGLPWRTMVEQTEWVNVEVHPGPFQCLGQPTGNTCEGQQLVYKMMVARTSCKWRTAYMHELLHLMLDVTRGDPDYSHKWEDAWKLTGEQLGECPNS